MWTLWEKGRDKYECYEDFKINFNPKSSIIKQIIKETKADISRDIQNLFKPKPTHNIQLGATKTQYELNNLNSRAHQSHRIRHSRNKIVKVRNP
jgi:hypothetical protein